MREILFRAKRVDNEKWIEGNLIQGIFFRHIDNQNIPYILNVDEIDCDYDNFCDLCDGFGYYEVDPSTICQWTGLKDRNNNKIWEHDIVTIKADDEYFHLEWEEDTARFVMNGDGFTVHFDNYWSYEVEIVGNIFDNSDLLGE